MSSIVKANLFHSIPQNLEYNKSKSEYRNPEQDRIANELKEKKETILKEAIKKAQIIENEAVKRAEFLVESAIKNSQNIMGDAQKKGYEEGYLQGLVDGANASEDAAEEGLNEIKRLTDVLRLERISALSRQEKDLVMISFEIAKKIMKHQVIIDENAIPKMLEDIMHENQSNLKISISEFQKTLDLHVDKNLVKKLRDTFKDSKVILIKEEDTILVETENGIIDMSVAIQLEQLKKSLDNI